MSCAVMYQHYPTSSYLLPPASGAPPGSVTPQPTQHQLPSIGFDRLQSSAAATAAAAAAVQAAASAAATAVTPPATAGVNSAGAQVNSPQSPTNQIHHHHQIPQHNQTNNGLLHGVEPKIEKVNSR